MEWEPRRRVLLEDWERAYNFKLTGQRGRPKDDLPKIAPKDDPLFELLVVTNPVPNARGWIAIECPWAEEHSPGPRETGYKPGGIFKCLHEACADRTISDLIEFLRVKHPDAVAFAIDKMPGPRGGLLRLML